MSTKSRFIRTDAYSLDRTEIEALNREGNQCDDNVFVDVVSNGCLFQFSYKTRLLFMDKQVVTRDT